MYEYKATLDRVIDGDTVDLFVDLGFNVTVRERFRLFGINAPESRTRDKVEKEKGLASKAYLNDILGPNGFHQLKIQTSKDSKGKYGRYLGTLFGGTEYIDPADGVHDWEDINELLVSMGHAVHKTY